MSEFVLMPGMAEAVERRSQRAALAAGVVYLQAMSETLSNSPARSGRRYEFRKGSLRPIPSRKRSRRRVRIHVASAPGEPPATLTGTLRRRRAQRLSSSERGHVIVEFGSKTAYARRLEVGDDDIAARPAWAPTMVASWPEMLSAFRAELNRGA